MIISFDDQLTEQIFHGIYSHKVRKEMPPQLIKKSQRRLDLLNSSQNLESLQAIPSLKKEACVRDAHGKYSIPIEGGWRIAFGWNDGPENVEIKSL
jgi:plasmid maintenance system killer protein